MLLEINYEIVELCDAVAILKTHRGYFDADKKKLFVEV